MLKSSTIESEGNEKSIGLRVVIDYSTTKLTWPVTVKQLVRMEVLKSRTYKGPDSFTEALFRDYHNDRSP